MATAKNRKTGKSAASSKSASAKSPRSPAPPKSVSRSAGKGSRTPLMKNSGGVKTIDAM